MPLRIKRRSLARHWVTYYRKLHTIAVSVALSRRVKHKRYFAIKVCISVPELTYVYSADSDYSYGMPYRLRVVKMYIFAVCCTMLSVSRFHSVEQ
jgi:hypothetical protein